jgi:formate-dependent nitrite reductase membrane component NrfD
MTQATYLLSPQWEWVIMLALFAAGVASGTYAIMGLMHVAGDESDRPVLDRMGLVPMPFMLITPVLLTLDLGQPGRFLNLLFTSPGAAERPGPIMFNPNSPMSWGSWAMILFAPFTLIAFVESLRRVRGTRIAVLTPVATFLSRNVLWLVVGELLALATSAYSGVLINVTNQGVWSDTYLMGGLFIAFSELSGIAVAAIIAGRLGSTRTAAAIRTTLFGTAVVTAILLVLWLGNLAALGSVAAVAVSLLVGPVFWIGAVGAALLVPIVTAGPVRLRVWQRVDQLAFVGAVVLLGVLAFRYATFFSAIAFIQR